MKKRAAVLAAILLIVFALCGCEEAVQATMPSETASAAADPASDSFDGEDQISLTVWAPENAVPLTERLCEDFISLYPEKTIAIQVNAQGEDDAAATVLADIDAAADVFSFACDQTEKLVKAGALSPVSDPEKVRDRNIAFTVAAATVGDELAAYPQTGENGYFLVYDKSVVSDEEAQTLEGILEACRKAHKKFILDSANSFYSCMYLFTGGMYLDGVTDDGVQAFNDYDEETVLDSLEAFSKLLHEYSDVFQSDSTSLILTGMTGDKTSVAAGIDGSWDGAALKQALGENFGAAKLPTININGTDTQIFGMNGCKLVGVNARSKFPAAAQLLADYLTDEACQQARVETLNWLPSNKNALEGDAIRTDPMLFALRAQSEYSIPQTGIADGFWEPVGALGKTVGTGEKTDRESLRAALDKALTEIKKG